MIITNSHVMSSSGMVEKNIVIDDGKIKSITIFFSTIPTEVITCEPTMTESYVMITCLSLLAILVDQMNIHRLKIIIFRADGLGV